MPTNIATNTLLGSIEWAKKFNFNRPSVLGNFLEPAVTSANMVKQAMMGAPFSWLWNTSNLTTTCVVGQQDYVINAPNFGWIEYASVQDIGQTPSKWYQIQESDVLALDSIQGRPTKISPLNLDTSTGDVTFRLMPAPDKLYPISMQVNQTPSVFTSVNDTWGPIPDYLAYIYNWGFLAMMWMFADDPRYVVANQKFVAHLLATQSGLSDAERNIFLNTWPGLSPSNQVAQQQGAQGRVI